MGENLFYPLKYHNDYFTFHIFLYSSTLYALRTFSHKWIKIRINKSIHFKFTEPYLPIDYGINSSISIGICSAIKLVVYIHILMHSNEKFNICSNINSPMALLVSFISYKFVKFMSLIFVSIEIQMNKTSCVIS